MRMIRLTTGRIRRTTTRETINVNMFFQMVG
ncbi:MAG: hypothetical protein KatS3mg109_2027 [Pirellulaceae bacterium]|nr:MAG: hypothetical protein KatS3mg109_2027 [Pirellulaceae bacterium]